MIRPAVAPVHRMEIVGNDAVCVLGAGREQMLRGRAYALLIPLLDGSRTTEECVDALEPLCEPAEVYFALDSLKRRMLVVEGGTATDPGCPYWLALGAHLGPPAGARIVVTSIGDMPADLVSERLLASGFEVTQGRADLNLVVAADYLDPALEEVNRDALRSKTAWMLANPTGAEPLIGPIFRPGRTACWECLSQRLRHHRPIASFLSKRGTAPVTAPPAPSLPATLGAAIDLTVALLAQSLAGHSTALEDMIFSLDLASWSTGRHRVTRRPQCPACGSSPTGGTESEPPLDQVREAGRPSRDGRHGGIIPDETLAHNARHVSPVTGLVARLVTIPSFDGLHYVAMAGRNYAFPTGELPALRHGLRSMSSGKGISESHAHASALCESLERYSGVFQGDEARIAARYLDIRSEAIDPQALLLFSDRQYREREAWNGRGSSFSRVPAPFDEAQTIEWTPTWSLTRGARVFLPTSYCYYGYPADPAKRFSFSDSNGCAAGNTRGEACVQGLLELIERDAVAIWWYNRLAAPRLDLTPLGEERSAALARAYAARGREIWALDLTSDLGVPVAAALSRRVGAPQENILFGFGCHTDPAGALLRAVSELNQGLSRVASADFDSGGSARFGDPGFRDWWRGATVAAHPYLGSADDPARPFPTDAEIDPEADILTVLRRAVENRGMEVIVLDQTRPDVGLPVLRVVVPGLRHFWPRFAEGRLYQVPVQMGRVAAPLSEDALNPVAMFL